MLNKNSSTFRIFLCSCHPEQARPTKEGGRSRRIPIYFLCHAASGSSHKTLLNSFASVAFLLRLNFKYLWLEFSKTKDRRFSDHEKPRRNKFHLCQKC